MTPFRVVLRQQLVRPALGPNVSGQAFIRLTPATTLFLAFNAFSLGAWHPTVVVVQKTVCLFGVGMAETGFV